MKKNRIHALKEDIGDFYTDIIRGKNADYFVYYYENYGYEGSGFAIWKKYKKYFYTELGHCSCNGPLDGIDGVIPYSLKEIKTIVSKNKKFDYHHSQEVLDYVKKLNKK